MFIREAVFLLWSSSSQNLLTCFYISLMPAVAFLVCDIFVVDEDEEKVQEDRAFLHATTHNNGIEKIDGEQSNTAGIEAYEV